MALVALSQLNRTVEKRPDRRPQMSDLKESGNIEQDADVIAFPFRGGYYRERGVDGFKNADLGLMNIYLGKARNDSMRGAELAWDNLRGQIMGPMSARTQESTPPANRELDIT